jgi:N-methylhydantoinase B
MNNLLIGGRDPSSGRPFAYYETLGGGHGAGPGWNGESAMQVHMTNTRNTPIEALEHAYPLWVIETRIRSRSGGRGRWRGGDGIVRVLRLQGPARVTVISERRTRGPYGLAGGSSGAPGLNRVRVRGEAAPRRLPGKFLLDLDAGAELAVESPGGGGHGRPRATRRGPAARRRRARARRRGA